MNKHNGYGDENPVIEIYKGKPIRNQNIIPIRVDQIIYKKLIDIQEKTKLSMRKILSYSSAPCPRCEMMPVRVFTEDGEVQVERGILAKRIPNSKSNKVKLGEKGRKVLDNSTGKIYDSISDVAKEFSLNYPNLVASLNCKIPNKTTFIFYEQNTDLRQDNQQIPR